MLDALNVYLNANDTSVLKYKPELGHGAEVLQELSDDAIAWLTVNNTTIDYPVMQGDNNDEYINKDPFGKLLAVRLHLLDSRNKGFLRPLLPRSTVTTWITAQRSDLITSY